MKLSNPSKSALLAIGLTLIDLVVADKAATVQGRLLDKCCQVGKERAIESPKFNCKMSARDALISGHNGQRSILALTAESILAKDTTFADQCEMVLETCCLAHHRTRNCDSGKQFAKSGAACMDVELSKEATIATESFNDCCMSCSLGILAAKNPAQNESSTTGRAQSFNSRCKLMSPLASSLSGQLYEQTYYECCQENLPRISSALLEPGAPIDCTQYNPCSQRCVSAGSFDTNSGSRLSIQRDRCDCFSGYKLLSDGTTCVDIDECKLNQHTCNRHSEVCDNIPGSFRCLARQSSSFGRSMQFNDGLGPEPVNDEGESQPHSSFSSSRLCPLGMHWSSIDGRCQSVESSLHRRSASLSASSSSSMSSSSASSRRHISREPSYHSTSVES